MRGLLGAIRPCGLGDFAVVAAEIHVVAKRRGLQAGLRDAAAGRRFKSDRTLP